MPSRIKGKPLGQWKAKSADWLQARQQGVTGTDIGTIMGLNPWKSPYALWCEKTGRAAPPDLSNNSSVEWGTRLEPIVAEKWLETHPKHIEPTAFIEYGQNSHVCNSGGLQGITWQHSEFPKFIANPDRLVKNPDGNIEILEIKTSPSGRTWQNGIPKYYLTQLMWYIDVIGVERGHFAVLIAGHDYREYTIEKDVEWIEAMREAAEQWIAVNIGLDIAPNLDSTVSAFDTIREMHPEIDTDKTVEIPAEIADAYHDAIIDGKDAEARKQDASVHILSIMGDAAKATCSGVTIATRRARKTKDGQWGKPFLQAFNAPEKETKNDH